MGDFQHAMIDCQRVYPPFRVDGPALFQSARVDGADFLNFDTPKKGVTSIPLTFVGRAIYARMCCQCVSGLRHLCRGKGKGERRKGKKKEKRTGERKRGKEKGQGRGKGKEKGPGERERDRELDFSSGNHSCGLRHL